MDHKVEGERDFGGNRGGEDHDLRKVAADSGINGVTRRSMEDIMKALQIPIVTGVLLGFLLLYDHHDVGLALAASGGRTGGSSFSSRSSSSSSRSSSSSSRSSSRPSYSSSGSYSSWTSSPEESSSSSSSEIIGLKPAAGFL